MDTDDDAPGLRSFEIDTWRKKLVPVNKVSTGGKGPCHVVVAAEGDKRYCIVANYTGASVVAIPFGADGTLGELTSTQDMWPFYNKAECEHGRQEAPHPHGVAMHGGHAFVCDLGCNAIVRFSFDFASGRLGQSSAKAFASSHKGAGCAATPLAAAAGASAPPPQNTHAHTRNTHTAPAAPVPTYTCTLHTAHCTLHTETHTHAHAHAHAAPADRACVPAAVCGRGAPCDRPRHVVFSGSMAYAVNELDNTVDCYHVDQASTDLARSEQPNAQTFPFPLIKRGASSCCASLRATDTGCNAENDLAATVKIARTGHLFVFDLLCGAVTVLFRCCYVHAPLLPAWRR